MAHLMDFLFLDEVLDLSVSNLSYEVWFKISFYVFLGHFLDQKRLRQGLYRHPWDDISYILPESM